MHLLSLPRIPKIATPVVVLALAISVGACSDTPNNDARGPGEDRPPTPVTFVEAQRETVRVTADYAGRLHGSREAEVRARVGGILEERLYEEGAVVAEGAALFRIDQRPYRIALQRAEAEKANAQAALNQAQREWRRVSGLFDQGAISERERDRSLSERELGEARLALAEAGVAQAQLDFDYTTVRAPIAGVTGLETVTAGNLLAHGALLTTVTQLDPVQVRFSLPAEDAATRRALVNDGATALLEAELLFPDGSAYELPGVIDFTGSTVEARTGNVNLRAEFPNPENRLVPGALVRVRLVIEELDAVHLVEPEAVVQGPAGPVLFVIHEETTVQARSVRPGPLVDGRQVILEGLSDGDRVVVNGQVALRDGAEVAPEARAARSE